MNVVDLRSDTITKPSAAMRRAMADAEVGDDVLDGDPTTRRLEERIAALARTEDALFFSVRDAGQSDRSSRCHRAGTELLSKRTRISCTPRSPASPRCRASRSVRSRRPMAF